MTQDIETINGHLYLVTRDDQGNIITQAAADTPTTAVPKPLIAKAMALVTLPVPLTQNQRDRLQQVTVALLLGLTDN